MINSTCSEAVITVITTFSRVSSPALDKGLQLLEGEITISYACGH